MLTANMNFDEMEYINQLIFKEQSIELSDLVDLSKYEHIWFTSDEHFGSQRALELSQRLEFMPNNISKMNNHIIKCHNRRASYNDLTIHLGDFGKFDYLSYLNGQHIIVQGNYELDNEKFFETELIKPGVMEKLATGISSVVNNIYINNETISKYFSTELCDKIEYIYLTHKPEDCVLSNLIMNVVDNDYKPFKLLSNDKYVMNLFGHIHEKAKVKSYGLNVGIDCHHYFPFSTEEVEFYLMAILKYYDQNVFM